MSELAKKGRLGGGISLNARLNIHPPVEGKQRQVFKYKIEKDYLHELERTLKPTLVLVRWFISFLGLGIAFSGKVELAVLVIGFYFLSEWYFRKSRKTDLIFDELEAVAPQNRERSKSILLCFDNNTLIAMGEWSQELLIIPAELITEARSASAGGKSSRTILMIKLAGSTSWSRTEYTVECDIEEKIRLMNFDLKKRTWWQNLIS